jgi:hypothetical protein
MKIKIKNSLGLVSHFFLNDTNPRFLKIINKMTIPGSVLILCHGMGVVDGTPESFLGLGSIQVCAPLG